MQRVRALECWLSKDQG